jgi:DnaJ domain
MPCVCEKCLQHSRTLGLTARAPSKAAIRKAFRGAAKQWHPDRFENDPGKRLEAEEHFKQIQIAYRELWDHCEAPEKEPEKAPAGNGFAGAAPPRKRETQEPPPIFFGNAPGCYVAPNFPWSVWSVIARHLQDNERALAFVDLSASAAWKGNRSQYIFLTSYRIFVRDALNVISLLWYTDLGDVLFLSQQKQGKARLWQKFVWYLWGTKEKYSLVIKRHNGAHFFSIDSQTDDRVKKVIYNFLLKMKQQQPH